MLEEEPNILEIKRNGILDTKVDLLQRDPIILRTYLSLALECFSRKKDFVIAVVVTEVEEEYKDTEGKTDYLPVSSLERGTIYLAESINMHRFSVSETNPNVISIYKNSVKDPIKQLYILNIYYYAISHDVLKETLALLALKNEEIQDKRLRDSLEVLTDLLRSSSVSLTANWIGTEDDYLGNSIFHQYIQTNCIIKEHKNEKEESEKRIEREREIFAFFFSSVIFLSIVSFIIHVQVRPMVKYIVVNHLCLVGICSVFLVVNHCV
ncbi:hypothetical protein NEFER03_0323 [Nematocida sp. LUAm3]|nr:hypothetical protein NEFER03_0323 [Nematocida sp. LUAm3]KAI5173775.1 hypothetical protein NEFER02_0291 [Nematocida sp. LUAm2]KAI5176998.1 hypothetical protein NEFER01_0323 [Nematocida sp. LUAm1]